LGAKKRARQATRARRIPKETNTKKEKISKDKAKSKTSSAPTIYWLEENELL